MSYGQSTLVGGQAVSSAGFNSAPVLLENTLGVSVVAEVTGAAGLTSASLKLQVSNDYGGKEASDAVITNWVDLPGQSQSVTGNGNFAFNEDGLHYRWVRLVWSCSAGTATLNAQENVTGF